MRWACKRAPMSINPNEGRPLLQEGARCMTRQLKATSDRSDAPGLFDLWASRAQSWCRYATTKSNRQFESHRMFRVLVLALGG